MPRSIGWLLVATALTLWPLAASAQLSDPAAIALLMKPQPVPDTWIGRDDAPVSLIEYASPNCMHCGRFQREVLPGLKAKYVDSGKLRVAIRDFPTSDLALEAAMIARCAGPRREEVLGAFLDRWRDWAFDTRHDRMLEVAKAAGVPAAAAETCLKDQKLAEAIRKGKEQSYPLKFDVVPAFFVNGVRYGQNLPDDAIDKALPASPSAPAPATTQPQGQTPSAAAPFKLLGWCDLVEKADPAAGKSLRTLDEQLARLATVNLQVAAADRGFQAQCRALNGKFEGPQMDKFSERTYELGLLRGKAADLGDAVRAVLKAEPIASIGKRGAANEADYCAFTLNAIAADLLKQADTLIKGGPIDCPAAGKR